MYFNFAHVAPVTEDSLKPIEAWVDFVAAQGADRANVRDAVIHGADLGNGINWQGLHWLFERLGSIIGVTPERILLRPTFAENVRAALDALVAVRSNVKSVMLSDLEHPTLRFAVESYCRVHKIELIRVSFPGAAIANYDAFMQAQLEKFKPDAVFVTDISHISGERTGWADWNVRDECMLVIDAVHSIGQVSLPSKKNTAILGSGHKWLGGLRGSSILAYSNERGLCDDLHKEAIELANETFSSINNTKKYVECETGSISEIPYISLGFQLDKIKNGPDRADEANLLSHGIMLDECLADSGFIPLRVLGADRYGIYSYLHPSNFQNNIAEILRKNGFHIGSSIGFDNSVRICLKNSDKFEKAQRIVAFMGQAVGNSDAKLP